MKLFNKLFKKGKITEDTLREKIKEKLTDEEYELFLKSEANNCLNSMLLFYDI